MKRKHNYKGGSIASSGYKIIYVGKDHHLADCRGYAYEHRVLAEQKIGRRLKPKEQVHHKDENKLNNDLDNLEVTKSIKHHRFFHRKTTKGIRMPDEKNVLIKCLCGCGREFMKYDTCGRERGYVSGHNSIINKGKTEIYILNALSNGEQTLSALVKNYTLGKSVKTVLTKLCKRKTIIRISRALYKLNIHEEQK